MVSATGAGAIYTGNLVDLIVENTGSGAGAHASSGGTIDLTGRQTIGDPTDLSHVSTYGTNSYGLSADSGGQITASDTAVYTKGDGNHGIYSTGSGSHVSLDFSGVVPPDGNGIQIVATNGNNAYGVYATNGGTVEVTGLDPLTTDVITFGTGSSAYVADSGGSIVVNDLSSFLSMDADNTAGAKVSGTGSSIAFHDSYVNTYGDDSDGILVTDGGLATYDGDEGAVVTGVFKPPDDQALTNNAVALHAVGVGSDIQVTGNNAAITYGTNSAGALAEGGATIEFAGNGISTYETGSAGAIASGTDGNGVVSTVTINGGGFVRTTGPSSDGVLATDGGKVIVTGEEITTGYNAFDTYHGFTSEKYDEADVGRRSNGAEVAGIGSVLELDTVDLTTNGDGAIGVVASAGSTATVTGGTITTNGAVADDIGADGVLASNANTSVTLAGGTLVTTAGVDAMGLHAIQGGLVDATSAVVNTGGTGAFGALSEGANSNVQLTDSSVTTQAASGLSVNGGGQINATNTDVKANGAGSSGILGTGDGTVTMTGGSLRAIGDLITGTAGDVIANLTGVAPTTGSGIVVHAIGGSTTGNFSDMELIGNVVGEGAASANATLTASTLTGMADNADHMTVDAASTWNMTASSAVNNNAASTTTNTGLIVFAPPENGVYKTLTTSNFVGGTGDAIGTVVLNTYLGSDDSPSDQIVIDGGTATGSTALTIVNNGGPGAATNKNGIIVVRADNGATTDEGAFRLSRAVAAGAYEYNLFRGGLDPNTGTATDQDWFLRNVGLNDSTQTSLPYAQILNDYAIATLGTLQQRSGNRIWPNGTPPETVWCKDPAQNYKCKVNDEQASVYVNGGPVIYGQGAWGRVAGQYSSFSPKVGSSYTESMGFMQAGYEGTMSESTAGDVTFGGYATVGTSRADVKLTRDPVTGALRKGKITTTGYGLGVNLTWLGSKGFYAGAIGQFTWYDSRLSNKSTGNNEGWSGAASIEMGKRIDLGSGWALVPQAQLSYANIDYDNFVDINGAHQKLGDGDSLLGRAGVRVENLSSWQSADNKTDRLQVYGIGNISYQFLKGTKIDVDNVSVEQQNQRLWGEVGLGGTYAWNDKWNVFGEADYSHALSGGGGGDNYAVTGTVGLRYKW